MSLGAFTAAGRFLKGNLHTHSNRSDGGLSPEEVCRRYRERDYDFLCLSDHFLPQFDYPMTDTRPFATDAFTTLIGAELHAPATGGDELWHILAVGLPLDFARPGDGETGPQLARRAVEAGAFVALPHPEWYGLTLEDAQTIPEAHAVEIYNHTSEVLFCRGGGVSLVDALLRAGRTVNVLACDDAHFNFAEDRERDAFGGWVMVKTAENTEHALVEALKRGNYYSTQGPEIHDVQVDGDKLIVESSPAAQVSLLGAHSLAERATGNSLERVKLNLDRFKGKVGRLVVRDHDGKFAWSNPITF